MNLHQPLTRGLFLALLSLPCSVFAADDSTQEKAAIPEPTQFVTEHKGRFNNTKMDYQAVAGETYLRNLKGEPTASIFSFAYLQDDVKDTSSRPVTFAWNGGPGSASVWLHMSGIAPVYVDVPSDASHAGMAPYKVKASSNSLMDSTDLVFIDPVGTGFSRALGDNDKKNFWGLKQDAESMASFIRTWITEHNRWNSPIFILGESYGTTRAAYVADILAEDMDINVNGLIFVSQALDYQGSSPYVRDNIISYITYLPTMAATALYHGKVTPGVDQAAFVQQARDFATNELLPALFAGNTISAQQREHIVDRLAYFTGLSKRYIERVNLRIDAHRFAKELLRDKGLSVGLLDGRYTSDEIDDVAARVNRDAASDAISPAFISALQHHMRNQLGVTWNRQYLAPSDPELYSGWQYAPTEDGRGWEPEYVNTAGELSAALRINPLMKVFVASGYFDLVTPFFDAEYTLNRHDIQSGRIQYEYYQGGHMMYVNGEARERLLNDARQFIKQQTAR